MIRLYQNITGRQIAMFDGPMNLCQSKSDCSRRVVMIDVEKTFSLDSLAGATQHNLLKANPVIES
jgi:hypothetical protein